MNALATIRRIDARILITGALVAALCAVFWLDSRYPSLQGKAGADPDEALSTPLGFEKHFPEPGAHETVKHTLWSAAEWAVTNKQGMTFGLLFAAGLLTLIPLLPRAPGGRFAGSVQGMLIGAPLGVCVNCAAPIGQAMLKAGARTEIALATMFASPSFNVIVLGMLLSLFPWHLVLLKIVTSALMVLAIVPLLSRLAERPGWRRAAPALSLDRPAPLPGLRVFQRLESAFAKADAALLSEHDGRAKGFLQAMAWVLLRYPRNLWTVIRLALPLMLLAGLIGAALVEVLPWGRLAEIAQVEGVVPNAIMLVVVAVFGVLLPVPIAFDVVVSAVLWNAGVPAPVVATLLVTLGIYSVYPASLLATTLSWRIATTAGLAVFALGVAAGSVAGVLDRWHELRLARHASDLLARLPAPTATPPGLPAGSPAAALREIAPVLPRAERLIAADGLELWSATFRTSLPGGPRPFTRLDGSTAGFERLPLPRPYRMVEPGVMHLGSIAAGDVNKDGWPDLAIGSQFGVYVYINTGGHFALQQIDFRAVREWTVSDVALVDLNDDAAVDLFFCAWMHGCHILYNRDGAFSEAAHSELPRHGETVVETAAFADVNRDGRLEIATGAGTYVPRFFYPALAVNRLWHNDGKGRFIAEALPGPEGETLSLLFADLNADAWPDLFVGNDFDEPDRVYMNEHGTLRPVTSKTSNFPHTTTTTMSADAGDIDNDGRDELYIAQIAMGSPGGSLAKRLSHPVVNCGLYADLADRARCDALARFQMAVIGARTTDNLSYCESLADTAEQRDCVVSAYHWMRVLARLPALGGDKAMVLEECARIPADFASMKDVCAAIEASPMDHEKSDEAYPDELPQLKHTNLLYVPDGSGYRDVTDTWKAGFGGWSWNSKFADVDNDGWQDLFIAQGSRLRPSSASNVFYKNQGGTRFTEETKAFGLEDHNPTGAYVYVDFDVDGDLDLVTYPFLMTPVVWRNDAPAGPGLSIALEDRRMPNRFALGARVEIKALDGRRQVRQIKGSGGYQSHDEPVAWFGLGNWPAVASIRIVWPDGQIQELSGLSLKAGRYRLVRTGPRGDSASQLTQ